MFNQRLDVTSQSTEYITTRKKSVSSQVRIRLRNLKMLSNLLQLDSKYPKFSISLLQLENLLELELDFISSSDL